MCLCVQVDSLHLTCPKLFSSLSVWGRTNRFVYRPLSLSTILIRSSSTNAIIDSTNSNTTSTTSPTNTSGLTISSSCVKVYMLNLLLYTYNVPHIYYEFHSFVCSCYFKVCLLHWIFTCTHIAYV